MENLFIAYQNHIHITTVNFFCYFPIKAWCQIQHNLGTPHPLIFLSEHVMFNHGKFDVLMSVTMKINFSGMWCHEVWYIGYHCFRWTCCLHFHGGIVSCADEISKWRVTVCPLVCFVYKNIPFQDYRSLFILLNYMT